MWGQRHSHPWLEWRACVTSVSSVGRGQSGHRSPLCQCEKNKKNQTPANATGDPRSNFEFRISSSTSECFGPRLPASSMHLISL